MSAVEGGSVVCFVLRVLGTLQYLCLAWEGGINPPLGNYPRVVVSLTHEFLAESAVFRVVCRRKKVLAVTRAGTPAKFAQVWAGLNGRSHSDLRSS